MNINAAGSLAGDPAAKGLTAVTGRGAGQRPIHVTDHALVRFLERAGALDVERLRGLIANSLERGRKAAERAGLADFTIVVDGLCYVVEGGSLVAVTDDDRNRRRWGR